MRRVGVAVAEVEVVLGVVMLEDEEVGLEVLELEDEEIEETELEELELRVEEVEEVDEGLEVDETLLLLLVGTWPESLYISSLFPAPQYSYWFPGHIKLQSLEETRVDVESNVFPQ